MSAKSPLDAQNPPLSNITYGVVKFPKTGAKSSKPFGNFFWRLGNFFGFDQFLLSNELSNIT